MQAELQKYERKDMELVLRPPLYTTYICTVFKAKLTYIAIVYAIVLSNSL